MAKTLTPQVDVLKHLALQVMHQRYHYSTVIIRTCQKDKIRIRIHIRIRIRNRYSISNVKNDPSTFLAVYYRQPS